VLQRHVRAQVPQVPAAGDAVHAVGDLRGPDLPQGVLLLSAVQALVRQGEDVQERQLGHLPELLLRIVHLGYFNFFIFTHCK